MAGTEQVDSGAAHIGRFRVVRRLIYRSVWLINLGSLSAVATASIFAPIPRAKDASGYPTSRGFADVAVI
jgi:hypothetical protein